MLIGELLERLDESGSMGLDCSPGDPLAAEAAEKIRELLSEISYLIALNSE